MSGQRCVLDTNILSYLLRGNRPVEAAFDRVLDEGVVLFFCPVVRYEIMRGFHYQEAPRQLQMLREIAELLEDDPYDSWDWERAALLWSECMRSGRPIGDADTLIAAYAINRDATLVTNNTRHFEHLPVRLENWLQNSPE